MVCDLDDGRGAHFVVRFTLRSCFYMGAAKRQVWHYSRIEPVKIDLGELAMVMRPQTQMKGVREFTS